MPKRLTTEEFIERARAVHGDRYDYSQSQYVNSRTKVTIICRDHGPFGQVPNAHTLQKQGCPICAGKNVTTKQFIEKARAVHGDRYDYSQVEYKNSVEEVTIICPDHGPFQQRPNTHVSQECGCPDCGGVKRLNTESFIDRARAVHGDRYDYSQVEYKGNKKKVIIICPDHGPFEQTPNSHLLKKGCQECGGVRRLTTDSFIDKAVSVQGNRYDYSEVKYVNNFTPVIITCPDHGPFEQIPYHHLNQHGCPECAGVKKLTTEIFIERARQIHGDRYDYSKVRYVNTSTKVTIVCPEHGPFEQTPDSHLSKKFRCGCPSCAVTGFNPNDRATLYYVAITTDDGDTRYKIGITNFTVEERFYGADLARIRIVKTWHFAIGRVAAEREAEILRQYAGDKYYGPDILQRAGNTELFTHDILGLDSDFDTES